ncbi:aldehyde dehydrogenase family protein [Acinetobacter baumannii]|uniref:Aldehyde dehydrogenase family protein n=8 Tax=Acinetobacter baumannii TaxID=470 RepID=A0A6I4IFW9_ACIBA|nr:MULTISPECIES: aldehyde dehydrogenase family protein [Acinetobacter]APJ19417.1 aldehyde dehydrogenase [Acinetobacter baumannii]AYY89123.1 aldehyde dehydrogenase family protein [Acinetobacter baumannii]EHZ6763383.1 aldehyde dehydrogenase family protein [Acinetobacter baumannii]EHZ6835234.1 aldehyde dehydrogenase family protein [Acinetobacter baumannii]EHZ6847763.1 aldehyde dehydrogenase family protein [Acinetobacter baumannii]
MNTSMYINGQTVLGTGKTIDVINPATLDVIATVSSTTPEQLDDCIAKAKQAFATWKNVDDQKIVQAFHAIAEDILSQKNELAILITQEQGKPVFLAQLEVELTAQWINYIVSLTIPVEHYQETNGKKITVYNRPLGVIASITPWNWPFMIAAWHLFPALKTKNCVINKPSEFTPLSTIKLVEIINKHLPAGVCSLVLGDGQIGSALTAHPVVEKVTFTGSTSTGQRILQNSINTLKSVVLELGGNDVGIVLDDVDVETTCQKLFMSAFLNAGQTCACLKRLYVHDNIYDQVVQKLTEIINAQVLGDGLAASTTFGPVQNKMQFDKVQRLIEDAIEQGATVIRAHQSLPEKGYFIAPTLVVDVNEETAIVEQEQFGPVLPILRFSDIDKVVESTNQSEFGLGGSVWTKDLQKAQEIAEKMETGTVWINSHADLSPEAAFGGWKLSGLGYSFGMGGLLQYTHKQSVHITEA